MYVQSDILLLADIFNNLQNMCLGIYNALFFCTRISMARSPKKTKSNLLTDINILLKVDQGIRGGRCYAIHQYPKANKTYTKY